MKILFPEGENEKIIKAVKANYDFEFEPVLFNDEFVFDESSIIKRYFELRKHKNITMKDAENVIHDNIAVSMVMLELGLVDAVVGGIDTVSAKIVSEAFKIIGTKEGIGTSLFVMEKNDEKLVFSDCAIIPDPNVDQLKLIAKYSKEFSVNILEQKGRVSFLSFSTGDSSIDPMTIKVKKAAEEFGGQGPIQFDAAYNKEIGIKKVGKKYVDTDVFVFPNLDSGNIGYKIASQMGGYKAIGPIMLGTKKVVNDLSRGSSVEEIIEVIKITHKQ